VEILSEGEAAHYFPGILMLRTKLKMVREIKKKVKTKK